jgi:Ca2+-transporting ATPase
MAFMLFTQSEVAATAHFSIASFIAPPSAVTSRQTIIRSLRGGGKPTPLRYNATAADPGSMTIADLYEVLETSPAGLTKEQAEARLQQYGRNALDTPPGKSVWQLILEQFEDRLVQILLAVAVLSCSFSYFEARQSAGDDALWKSFVEPFVIVAILALNAAVGVWQTSSAQDSLEALQKMQPSLATVLRDQLWQSGVDASELVPGDIIEIRVGDKIPADARLTQLQSSSMQVDEGSLTGESVTVGKYSGREGTVAPNLPIQDQKGMLYSGTMVTSGAGRAVIVQTGMATQFGKIQKGVTEAKEDQPKTPLAIKLDEFGNNLTVIIGVICLSVWVISIPKMDDPSFSSVWEGAIYYAKVAVALGVAAIPEGLPAVITLCLSLGTRRMAQRNVIVRKLASVETLGCTSVICTDKTGTLTQNEMTVVSLVMFEKEKGKTKIEEHVVEGFSYSPVGSVDGVEANDEVRMLPNGGVALVAAVSALCNDAKIVGRDSEYPYDEEIVDGQGNTVGVNHQDKQKKKRRTKEKKNNNFNVEKAFGRVGEPTEAALCVLAEKLGGMAHYLEGGHLDSRTGLHVNVPPSVLASANVNEWRSAYPRVATLEFNRDRKSMSVLCKNAARSGNRLLVKGAPNLLIERCINIKLRDGSVIRLTGELRRRINSKVSDLATRPLRCLALALKDADLESSLKNFKLTEEGDVLRHPLLRDPSKYKDIESGLTLVGIVGIKDPARPEVAASIEECKQAGIRVLMITGDAKDTAVSIARDVNIFPPEESGQEVKAFEGREFFLKSQEEQIELLKEDNIVFCRAEPADKQKIIKMLQGLGEIPAMTGDGVNDAAALQQAAIGVAMGITGTEVSKEAADMILADDNFSTIVAAVEEGRRIYANMQAFICFLISCNIGEICAILMATMGGFPEPLTAMHLLWVNLVTDGPPATALGFNPPSPDLMTQPPRPSNEPIMTRWLLTRYCVTGLYVGVATVGVFVGHYLGQGVSLSQLSNWSKCGVAWLPTGGATTCTDLFHGQGRMLPQTLSLTTLVVMEMLKALSAVSVDNSLLRVGPFANPWLIIGVSFPFLLHLGVLYSADLGFPAVAESFGMSPLTASDWTTVWSWALPVLLVEEIMKAIGRYLKAKRLGEIDAAK